MNTFRQILVAVSYVLALLAAVVLLANLQGCANFVDKEGSAMASTPSQQYAGILHVSAVVNDAPIELITGKESQDLLISGQFDQAGKLSSIQIQAKQIEAFQGQAISAEAVVQIRETIFTKLTEAGVNVTRSVVEGAVNAALGRP